MKKVVILVNKAFEYEGFRRGIASVYANAEFARRINLCEDNIDSRQAIRKPPLATYVFENLEVEVYCIQYLFGKNENSSNSEQKYYKLIDLFDSFTIRPDYVISVSTSESTKVCEARFGRSETVNGCVFVGNQFFLSDQRKFDPATQSHLDITKPFYEDPLIHDHLYNAINDLPPEFLGFKKPPCFPASTLKCFASANFVGIDVVNVMDYSRYKDADEAAYKAFQEFIREGYRDSHFPIGIETTHGVVKKVVAEALHEETPVMFISPITDRYLKFDEDVDKDGIQNFTCSYNSGVATGHILTILDKLLGHTNK